MDVRTFEIFLFEVAKKYSLELLKEYKFIENRRFRFDYAFTGIKLALEIEGGIYVGGRHVRGVGYTRDVVKYNYAMVRNWKVLRVTTEQIRKNKHDKEPLTYFIERVIKQLLNEV